MVSLICNLLIPLYIFPLSLFFLTIYNIELEKIKFFFIIIEISFCTKR